MDERTELLPKSAEDTTTTTRHEAKVILGYAVPIAITTTLRYLVSGAAVLAAGRLGTRELAAANLANLTCNVTGLAIVVGIAGALDTLCNQASTSRSPKLSSLYAMRCFIVMCMVMPILLLLNWNGKLIFRIIVPKADPEIVRIAVTYMKMLSLGTPPIGAYECIRRYLASNGILKGPAISYAIGAPLAIFFNWLFVHGPDRTRIGIYGAALSSVLVYWVLLLFILLYAIVKTPRHTWYGLSTDIFRDLGIVIRLGGASIISTCSEWYAFEAISLISTYYGSTSQASVAIMLSVNGLMWSVPTALGSASAIRVGNLLGSALPRKASVAATAAQISVVCIMAIECILLFILRRVIGNLFSNDEAVINKVDATMWVVCLVCFFDGVQGTLTGVLRGCGLPEAAAQANLFAYWALGLPIGLFITIQSEDITGLFFGLFLAVFCTSSVMAFKLHRNDWRARSQEASSRIADSDANANAVHENVGEVA